MTPDFDLYSCTKGPLTVGISVRGDVVVAAPPVARWTLGKRWSFVKGYFSSVERCNLAALVDNAPVSSGPVTLLDPVQTFVAEKELPDLSWLPTSEGDSPMASRKKNAAAQADKPKRASKKSKTTDLRAAEAAGQTGFGFAPGPTVPVAPPFDPHAAVAATAFTQMTPAQIVSTIRPDRPYVTHITTSAKGMAGLAGGVLLGRLTFIVGNNSTGKTAIVSGVEAALSAAVSDIAGRGLVKEEGEILTLGDGETFTATARISDGTQAQYAIGVDGKKKAQHVTGPLVRADLAFPLRLVREGVIGEASKVRRFFLEHAVGKISYADIIKHVEPPLQPRLRSIGIDADVKDMLDALLDGIDAAEKHVRGERAKAKGVGEVVDAQAGELPPEPTEAQVAEAKAALDQWRDLYGKAATQAALGDSSARLYMLNEERNGLATGIFNAEQALTAPAASEDGVIAMAMVGVLQWHIDFAKRNGGYAFCGACGAHNVPVEEFERRAAALQQTAHDEGQKTARRQETLMWLNTARARVQTLETLILDLTGKISRADALPDGTTVEGAKAALDGWEAEHTRLVEIRAKWSGIHSTRNASKGATGEEGVWKDLVKALKASVAALVEGAIFSFEARVQRYLPPTERFGVSLSSIGKRDAVRFGLYDDSRRDDPRLRSALGGAEWARVTVAVAMAISEGYEGVSVLVPEDRAFDPDTLTRVLTAFGNYGGQVIVTHPTPPTSIPAGWTVVDTRMLAGNRDQAMTKVWPPDSPKLAALIAAEDTANVGAGRASPSAPPLPPAPPVKSNGVVPAVAPGNLAASLLGGGTP